MNIEFPNVHKKKTSQCCNINWLLQNMCFCLVKLCRETLCTNTTNVFQSRHHKIEDTIINYDCVNKIDKTNMVRKCLRFLRYYDSFFFLRMSQGLFRIQRSKTKSDIQHQQRHAMQYTNREIE